MKSKAQKQEELKKGKELLEKSQSLVFVDFSNVPTAQLRKLRQELKAVGAKLFIIKKRLLNILMKERGIDAGAVANKLSLGTIFSEGDIEKVSGPVYKLLAGMEVPEGAAKDVWVKHIVGGYDISGNASIGAEKIIFIGKLPPREVLLAQILGMFAAPLRSFLYILDQKSKSAVN